MNLVHLGSQLCRGEGQPERLAQYAMAQRDHLAMQRAADLRPVDVRLH